jgi:hypothetical protein
MLLSNLFDTPKLAGNKILNKISNKIIIFIFSIRSIWLDWLMYTKNHKKFKFNLMKFDCKIRLFIIKNLNLFFNFLLEKSHFLIWNFNFLIFKFLLSGLCIFFLNYII